MPDIDYIPTTDPKLQIWFGTFAQKFSQYAERLGFLSPDVTAANNDYAMI